MTAKTQVAKPDEKHSKIIQIRISLLALSFIGTSISGYLVYAHFFKITPVCLPSAPCEVVLTSRYAEMWGVPLSLLGLLMYISLLSLCICLLQERNEDQGMASILIYTLSLSGSLFSLYLLYLEAFVIRNYCTWCLASGIVIWSILVMSLVNLSAKGLSFESLSHYLRENLKKISR